MVVEVMPVARVRMLGRSGVMSIDSVAYVVNDRIQIVERSTSTHKHNLTVSRSCADKPTILMIVHSNHIA